MMALQFWFPAESFGSASFGDYGKMDGFMSHIRIQATLDLAIKFSGGFGIKVTAVVTLAIDLDAANNGIGGPDHAVLFDMMARPVLTGPPIDPAGTPSFELGGIEIGASLHWRVCCCRNFSLLGDAFFFRAMQLRAKHRAWLDGDDEVFKCRSSLATTFWSNLV
jgi:hypothetical protein